MNSDASFRIVRSVVILLMALAFLAMGALSSCTIDQPIIRVIVLVVIFGCLVTFLGRLPPPPRTLLQFAGRAGPIRLCIIDNNAVFADELKDRILSFPKFHEMDLQVDVAYSHEDFATLLSEGHAYHAITSDLHCPDYEDGIKNLQAAASHGTKTRVLMTSAPGEIVSRLTDNLNSESMPCQTLIQSKDAVFDWIVSYAMGQNV